MEMYDEDDQYIVDEEVYADLIINNCDTPGARKVAATASHNHKAHPFPYCKIVHDEINCPSGYNYEGARLTSYLAGYSPLAAFQLKDDYELLKHKYRSKDSPEGRKQEILDDYGVRFSALDWIPGWRPSKQTALDFMHCIFLGALFLHMRDRVKAAN